MTQFLIATYDEPSTRSLSEEERAPIYEAVGALITEAVETGILVFAGGLEDQRSTTLVDPRSGTIDRQAGPLHETRAYLGGMTIIDVPDRETATVWATRMAEASRLPQELRPFQAEPEEL